MKHSRPRTVASATTLCLRRAELAAQIAAHEAERAGKLAEIDAAADVVVAPLVEEALSIERALQGWWTTDGQKLTDGKRKSVELGGCTIGTRSGTASLAFEGGDAAGLKAALASPLKRRLTVARDPVLDKKGITALLKAGGTIAVKILALGFRIEPGAESFFVTPAGSASAKVSAQR